MAGRAEADIEQALGDGAAGLKPRGPTRRGGPWGPCLARSRHGVLAALSFVALAAPATARPTRGPAARARAASERCASADALPGQAAGDDLRAATLCLMNAERTARGLGRLQAEPLLGRVAGELRAPDGARALLRPHLARRLDDARAHQGDELPARRRRSWSVGENLAWGTGALATPRAMVRAWMQSAEHRANLLDRRFADVGIGVAAGAPVALEPGELGGTYVTDFGRRLKG